MPLAAGPLPAGWHELRLSGIDSGAGQKLVLLLEIGADTSTRWELALPAVRDGELSQILHLSLPVRSARLSAETAIGGTARASLIPLDRLGVLLRGWRRDRQETVRALRWRVLGKKVRARNMLMRLFGLPRRMAYQDWRRRNDTTWREEVAALTKRTAIDDASSFSAFIHSCRDGRAGRETLASLDRQLLKFAEVRLLDATQSLAGAIRDCRSDWVMLIPDGHSLEAEALLRIAAEAGRQPEPCAITWDCDRTDRPGHHTEPELKPQWNEALYLARDYVGTFAVSRAALDQGLQRLRGLPPDLPDALLLAAARSGRGHVHHIPRVLSNRLNPVAAPRGEMETRRRLVEAFIREEDGRASAHLEADGIIRTSFPVPQPAPLVSLIVPTRDRIDLLAPCVSGLLERTAYKSIEVLIADNGSSRPETKRYFDTLRQERRVRIIDCSGPFNFSAINNKAVAAAKGSVLGFINNDIEVQEPGWLTEMVGHALRPGIGAVGARLIYASGLVQHAGVILGLGGYAGHAHRFAHPKDWGYLGRLQCQQYFAAVTAACLVVERAKFAAVDGFDAEAFPVAYNDVDLCLRLRAAGFETLWTPYAELLHKESASRVRDYAPERLAAYEKECAAFLARWRDLIEDDPHYHPALSRRVENFSLE